MFTSVEPVGRMTPYGSLHVVALAVTVVAAVLLIAVARHVRGTKTEDRMLTVMGWIMLTATIAWMIWNLVPVNWNIEQSLPLHLSDALRIVTSLALLRRSGWAIAISYFWGLTLNLQSVITPDLTYFHAPVFEYIAYWFFHIAALVVPIMFVWGLGYRPTWRGYAFTIAATVMWAVFAGIANALTGANYMYLARAPEVPSALDYLGPWPVYLGSVLLLIGSVWALITLPWNAGRAAQDPKVGALQLVRRRPNDQRAGRVAGS